MKNANEGSALILALWVTAFLSLLVVSQATRVGLQVRWLERMKEIRQSRYLAWAGVREAMGKLSTDEETEWDAPTESWGRFEPADVAAAEGRFNREVVDEGGRIPFNAADAALLAKLPGMNELAAQELVKKREGEGAAAFLHHAGQLLSLTGFQKDRLADLEPLISFYSTWPVNINTAPAQVLTLLGLSDFLAQRIVRFRLGTDGRAGTDDDGVFKNLKEVQFAVSQAAGPLSTQDQTLLAELLQQGKIGVSSSVFRVIGRGWSAHHAVYRQTTAIVERAEQGAVPIIRSWNETATR